MVLEAAKNGVKFGTVVLFVPAVDYGELSSGGRYESAIQNIDHLVIVYSKNQEVVFGTSYKIARFNRALGEAGPSRPVNHPNLTLIDATNSSGNKFGIEINDHGDIYESRTMDMLARYLNEGK